MYRKEQTPGVAGIRSEQTEPPVESVTGPDSGDRDRPEAPEGVPAKGRFRDLMAKYGSLSSLLGLGRRATSDEVAPETPRILLPEYLDIEGLARDLEHELVFEKGAWTEAAIAPERRKVALAISGGGAAGAYSAGVLEALLVRLKERGIEIDLMVGTSAGALNAYGVFLERLGKANPQMSQDPDLRQPYSTFIASIWSYLDRDRRTSTWVAGRRGWIVDLASRGVGDSWVKLGLGILAAGLIMVLNPFLLVSLSLALGADRWLPEALRDWGFTTDHPLHFAVLGFCSLLGMAAVAALLIRSFRRSLFRDVPLLRLLANTGPDGDLGRPRFESRGKTVDQARVLSREIVHSWYERQNELPELMFTATNVSLGSDCLFTLVRPDTYQRLVKLGWLAVQLDGGGELAGRYRRDKRALFTLPENFLRCMLGSTAVPGAFPAQQLGVYGPDGRHEVRHFFVDGGVLNNSPVHIAIDAGATHIISLELEPLDPVEPLEVDDRDGGYNLLETAVTTFSTLLKLSTRGDIRRTTTWNRFLVEHPQAAGTKDEQGEQESDARPKTSKRIVALYRIAPEQREIGTVEFDGHYETGKKAVTLRDLLRRGYVDMQGKHIWRATLQPHPGKEVEPLSG